MTEDIAGIEYTHGYYRELSPQILRFACLCAGFAPPPCDNYLELGFGQGLSLAIHAAANEGQFWGNDFNPVHVAHAKTMGSPAIVLGESFRDLGERSDLPDFDVIAMHGIWSWVPDEARRTIVDLIRRKLRPNGLVYVTYNCLPGWAGIMPLRHLMETYARDSQGSPEAKVAGAIELARRVNEIRPLVGFDGVQNQDPAYIAHEYLFCEGWSPFGSAEIARWLAPAGLEFVASADLTEHVDSIQLVPEGIRLMAELPPALRQTVRDLLVNQSFRKDIFARAPQPLSGPDLIGLVNQQKIALSLQPEQVPLQINTPLGLVSLREEIYRPVLEAIAAKGYVVPIGDLPVPLNQAFEIVRILVGFGALHPAQEPLTATRQRCAALNRYLDHHVNTAFRASPVTGCGHHVRGRTPPPGLGIA